MTVTIEIWVLVLAGIAIFLFGCSLAFGIMGLQMWLLRRAWARQDAARAEIAAGARAGAQAGALHPNEVRDMTQPHVSKVWRDGELVFDKDKKP